MAKKNDNTIMALKKQIADKKAALEGIQKFVPVTNCSLTIDGERVNLHVASEAYLKDTMVYLNTLRLSALDLGIEYKYQGYSPEDWLTDCRAKLLMLNRKAEEARLATLEAKLDDLLSAEKKTELILDEIKDLV